MIAICPNCGKETVFLNNVCEHCNCEIKRCPECGKVALVEKETCDYCGYVLREEKNVRQKEDKEIKILRDSTPINGFALKIFELFTFLGVLAVTISVALICLFLYKLTTFGDIAKLELDIVEIANRISNASKVEENVSILLIAGLFFYLLSNILLKGRGAFCWYVTSKKMQELKFDSSKYSKIAHEWYANNNVDKKNYPLLLALTDKFNDYNDRSENITKFVFWIFILLVGLVLIYLGLNENISLYIEDVVYRLVISLKLPSNFSFDFNWYIIIGAIIVIASTVVSPIKAYYDKKTIPVY